MPATPLWDSECKEGLLTPTQSSKETPFISSTFFFHRAQPDNGLTRTQQDRDVERERDRERETERERGHELLTGVKTDSQKVTRRGALNVLLSKNDLIEAKS